MDTYTARVGKHRLRYDLRGNALTCVAEGEPGMKLEIDLRDPSLAITERKAFHRAFWGGWVGIIGAAFTLEMIRARDGWDGVVALGWSILLQVGLFAAGVVLIVLFRRRRQFADVVVNKRAAIMVWRDDDNAGEYSAFVKELTSRASAARG